MGDTWTGKRVRCTGAGGFAFETVARSEPHLNEGETLGRVKPWMVVVVDVPGEGVGRTSSGALDIPPRINWPLTDIELVPSDEGGDE